MAAKFDLNLFPLYRIKGQDRPQLPGLLVMAPPKRAARGREEDRLVIYLSFSGNTPFSSTEYNQITAQMWQRFYHNAGSLTASMRATAETLNQFLVERNLRTTGQGQYVIGRLVLGVLREAQFVMAQCGPTHAFHLSGGETRPIHDTVNSGRGLGFSQTTAIYFAQADLHAGDLLVLCAQLPSSWENTLLSEHGPSADALRRKLITLPGDDWSAVLIQAQAGQGTLNLLQGSRPAAESPAPVQARPSADPQSASGAAAVSHPARTPPPGRVQTSHVESSRPADRFTQILSGEQPPTPAGHPGRKARESAAGSGTELPAGQTGSAAPAAVPRRPSRFVSPHAASEVPKSPRPAPVRRQTVFRLLVKAIQGTRSFVQKISQGIKAFVPRLLPDLKNEPAAISRSSMALIAIAVPILVVLVASMVYLRYGRSSQYQENYDQAVAAAVKAIGQSDPLEVRHGWESALYYLNEAEKYQVTQDSQELRREAQTALDNLDGIIRLDFRPAIINGLSRTIEVGRMAATDTDLYLLNAARGDVVRASLTSQGYEVDPAFKCGPGQYGQYPVGTLIDIAALPKANARNASVLAMDANATLLYCAPDKDPIAVPLAAPELGFREISAFMLDADGKDLYVLDPQGNAVWVYSGDSGNFPDLPILFFGEQVPQDMNTAIDLAANGADLYLLFQDGHVTSCTLSRLDVVPTRCTDPVSYIDNRPGGQTGPKITDAVFTQLDFAAPPDPSLYLFEALTQAVYRFSPQTDSLTLQGQFRATEDRRKTMMSEPATAMAINPNRYLFLSVGNQVYFAMDVP